MTPTLIIPPMLLTMVSDLMMSIAGVWVLELLLVLPYSTGPLNSL